MKAMVLYDREKPFRLEERPDPRAGPGEAVMKVRAAGVGLTLINMRLGRMGGSLPRVMGHELAGEIVETGEGVTALSAGDRCAVYFYLTCGRCRWCRGGRETLCENFAGYVGGARDGGFAEYVCLPAENFLPIPEGLSDEAAAVAADAVNTNWHCMRERARVGPNDTVLLIGAGGGVGIHGVQVARLFGARVIAADVSDEKLDLARRWGAEETINVRAVDDVAEEARRLTGGRGSMPRSTMSATARPSPRRSTASRRRAARWLSASAPAKRASIRPCWSGPSGSSPARGTRPARS